MARAVATARSSGRSRTLAGSTLSLKWPRRMLVVQASRLPGCRLKACTTNAQPFLRSQLGPGWGPWAAQFFDLLIVGTLPMANILILVLALLPGLRRHSSRAALPDSLDVIGNKESATFSAASCDSA